MMAYAGFNGLSDPGRLQAEVCALPASGRTCGPRLTWACL